MKIPGVQVENDASADSWICVDCDEPLVEMLDLLVPDSVCLGSVARHHMEDVFFDALTSGAARRRDITSPELSFVSCTKTTSKFKVPPSDTEG